MIVKNPYKVLVKNYRIINLLLLIPVIYLLFTFTDLATFFKGYVDARYYTMETDLVSIYIPKITMIAAVGTAVLHFIIWLLLTIKKKNNYYHIISAGYLLVLFLALVFFYTSLLNIEMGNVDNTFANFLRDISDLVVYPIYILIVMGGINVVGLNVKTLRFDKHEDLKLTEEDEEDIEIKVGSDTDVTKKRFVHVIRELKYYVIENKAILAIIIIAVIGMFGYKAFINYQIYNRAYNVNQAFELDNFALSIKESYITPYDYSGRVITPNKYYLAIRIGIENKGSETTISKDVFRLNLGDSEVYPSYDKGSRFVDIGLPYTGDVIREDEAHDYVFIYELTEKQLKASYELRILNDLRVEDNSLKASYKKIKVRPEYLSEFKKRSTKKVKEKITFSGSTLKNTNYTLNSVRIQPSYNYSYTLCYTERNCSDIKDIIVPSGGKMLMIIEDEIEYDNASSYASYDKKNFYEDFITVQYTFRLKTGNNVGEHTQIANVKEVTPKKLEGKRIYEVPSNIENAEKINFLITIRNQQYTIKVKEK